MPLRCLIVSDSPLASSGYSVQTGQIARALKDLGCEVGILCAFGHHGSVIDYHGIPMFPGGMDGFANDVIGPTAREFKADVVITLKDLWVYRPQEWGPGLRWIPLVPVDHDPIPQGIVQMIRQYAWETIAYSQFGKRELDKAGFAPYYAPHTFDPQTYPALDREQARKEMGIPDDVFVIGMVAVNRGTDPSRKAWPQNIEAFARFAAVNPKAMLYLHTHTGETGREGAVNLPGLCQQLGILDRVRFCDQAQYDRGFPVSYLNTFYHAIDVLNTVSVGEGFGIPTLEAQAVGTPVVCSGWTASEELHFAGVAIPKSEAFAYYDRQGSYIFLPNPDAIALAFDTMYQRLGRHSERVNLRARALSGSAPYAIDRVKETHWRPIVEAIVRRLQTEHSRGVLRIVPPLTEMLGVSVEADAWAGEVQNATT